jgi:hypothetical protein
VKVPAERRRWMERMAFIIGLLGASLGAMLWVIQLSNKLTAFNLSNVEVVIFLVGFGSDVLGVILGIRALVSEGRSKEAIGGIAGGLVGLILLGLWIFVSTAGFATPR